MVTSTTGQQAAAAPFSPFSAACPTRTLLDSIADKWATLVIDLLGQGPLRFGALRRAIGGISQKMLTQTLRSLERDGLVSRRVYPTTPPSVEYGLTPLGATLIEPIGALRAWAEANIEQVLAARAAFDERSAKRAEPLPWAP
ncbi:MAG TPA: helix-turn-helix domain-containing protein [Dehalococcoidia bacterium]|jgi:DNA-binding HxlR family transcriptional regulator